MKLTVTASHRNRLQVGAKATEYFIKTIQWQSFQDFELIIADGGSDNYDELKDYIENYGGPIPMRMVQHKIGDAFLRSFLNNVGIRNAKSEYVMTTDVDMAYGPEFMSTLNSLLDQNVFIDSRTMYWKPLIASKVYSGEKDLYNDIESCRIGRIKKKTTAGGCQCTHINNWHKVRGFDESYVGWGSEDQDLLKRMKKARLKIKWMGESRDTIMLFHQPHRRNDLKKDLEYQNENKRRLAKVKGFSANKGSWGGIEDEDA